MLIALYWLASFLLLVAAIFLVLYRAYGRGWNDHAQRNAEAAKRALARQPISWLAPETEPTSSETN